jgi:DNA-binding LacI/PurR family transcriptional regulator
MTVAAAAGSHNAQSVSVYARGYSLVLAEHHYDLGAELRTTEQLIRHGVDAFVFVGLEHDPALFALLESYGRPYVLTCGVDVEIGRAAAEQVVARLAGRPYVPFQTPGFELVSRGSTAGPAKT